MRYPRDKEIGAQSSIDMIGKEAHERAMEARTVTADVRRLSDVLAAKGPSGAIDLVKIDVEGAELDVLYGIDSSDWARISQFVIEVQDLDGRLEGTQLQQHDFDITVEPGGTIRVLPLLHGLRGSEILSQCQALSQRHQWAGRAESALSWRMVRPARSRPTADSNTRTASDVRPPCDQRDMTPRRRRAALSLLVAAIRLFPPPPTADEAADAPKQEPQACDLG
jgi:hypothetical protein